MTKSETVLVLGGGVGGLVAAVELRKKLPDAHRVVLVDRSPTYLFDPSLLWVMTGLRTPDKISRSRTALAKRGIDVEIGTIEQIDPKLRTIRIDGTEIAGDHLVVSLGADYAPEAIPGLAAAGHNFYTLEGAQTLRDSLRELRSGRLVVLTAAPAYKCPAAPYEAALLLEYDCRKRKVRDDVRIDVYAAEPAPMGVAGPAVSAAVRQMLEDKHIGYYPESQVDHADPSSRRLSFTDGEEVDYDLLAYVPPHRAPDVVRQAGLTNESGWVPVDRYTFETEYENVYAIGDVTTVPLSMGKPLPKAGVFAHGEAEVVAENIAHIITDKGRTTRFDGHGECFIEAGDGKAGFGRGDFYAEPAPDVKLHKVGRHWHAGKVLFEKEWLRKWF